MTIAMAKVTNSIQCSTFLYTMNFIFIRVNVMKQKILRELAEKLFSISELRFSFLQVDIFLDTNASNIAILRIDTSPFSFVQPQFIEIVAKVAITS